MLRDDSINDYLRDMVKTATLSTECVLSILDDILLVNKSQFDGLEVARKLFRPADVVAHVQALFLATANIRGFSMRSSIQNWTELDDEDLVLLGDGRRLCQILINLVANALKFGRSEGDDSICIDLGIHASREAALKAIETSRFLGDYHTSVPLIHCLKAEATDPLPCHDPVYLFISVKDNGIGIEPEALHRLFQPFQQLESGESRKFQGTGLGLTICKSLCELMNGAIWCSVPKDQHQTGCSFDLFLQLHKPSQEELANGDVESLEGLFKYARSRVDFTISNTKAAKGSSPEAKSTASAHGTATRAVTDTTVKPNGKILVAEDNPISLVLLKRILQRITSGYEVIEAKDGAEAVKLFHKHPTEIKLCLFDYHMPRMDGLAAAREGEHGYVSARCSLL